MRDRKFEQQFQWEVDRLVFRHRHGGDPIEVTQEERDRLVERHRWRMGVANKVLAVVILSSVLVIMIWPTKMHFVPVLSGVAVICWMPALNWWAYSDVTAGLRQRTPIGLRLGFGGRVARQAQALRWRDLLGGSAYLVVVSVLTANALLTDRAQRLAFIALDLVIGALFAWMMLMKWAQRERDRLHDEKIDAIHRARELR
jgi:hypothetical protein